MMLVGLHTSRKRELLEIILEEQRDNCPNSELYDYNTAVTVSSSSHEVLSDLSWHLQAALLMKALVIEDENRILDGRARAEARSARHAQEDEDRARSQHKREAAAARMQNQQRSRQNRPNHRRPSLGREHRE